MDSRAATGAVFDPDPFDELFWFDLPTSRTGSSVSQTGSFHGPSRRPPQDRGSKRSVTCRHAQVLHCGNEPGTLG